jgi:hypothetical protein
VNFKPGPKKSYPIDRSRDRLLNINSKVMRRSSVIRKYLLSMSMAALVILTSVSVGQAQAQTTSDQTSVDQDIALLRKDIRSDKKQIIAANMQLTDAEAPKFWPVYDQYTAELAKINDAKVAAIKDYAANYSTLSDDKALALTRQIIGIEESVGQLRLKYVPIFSKVISGKKTALFFQLDRRLTGLVDLQVASEVPLVEP